MEASFKTHVLTFLHDEIPYTASYHADEVPWGDPVYETNVFICKIRDFQGRVIIPPFRNALYVDAMNAIVHHEYPNFSKTH